MSVAQGGQPPPLPKNYCSTLYVVCCRSRTKSEDTGQDSNPSAEANLVVNKQINPHGDVGESSTGDRDTPSAVRYVLCIYMFILVFSTI